jgi:hypothetical protein
MFVERMGGSYGPGAENGRHPFDRVSITRR